MGIVYRNIEAERIKKGSKRDEMAVVCEISLKTYNNWIRGKTDIPCSKLKIMSEFFNVSIDYLLERYEAEQKQEA